VAEAMKLTINIASVSAEMPADVLAALAKSEPGLFIFDVSKNSRVGKTTAYGFTGPDLWAEVELDEGVSLVGVRAAAAIVMAPTGPVLAGVMLTRLSRPMIEAVGLGLSYPQAVTLVSAKKGQA
jgi:hypothetical protein